MNVRELGSLLRSRKISCVELIAKSLSLAKQHEDLRAFITITADEARREAQERDTELANGIDRGPFHGIPIALKDLFYTRGIRTTAGSPLFQDFVPSFDATVVERLRAAGAVSIGKTNLHELAFGITSKNPHFGAVVNPIDEARLPGGSSGGSAAAVATGMVPLALGTDTGGSIRIPSSYCGVVGLKPTYGRVSRRGVLPLAFSLDHVGPIGSCVEDCALTMNVIAGPDGADASCATEEVLDFDLPVLPDMKGLRLGVPRNFFFDQLDDQVAVHVKNAIAAMGRYGANVSEVSTPNFEEANLASQIVQFGEFAALHVQHNDHQQFGTDVWSLLAQGRAIAAHEYVNAQRLRTLFRNEMDRVWNQVDVLVTPTTPISAPLANVDEVTINGEKETVRMASTRLVRAFNYFGEPALSMPCGKTEEGLPVGLQLISAPFTESRLLQTAKTLEGILGRFSFERQA
ncbi:MAG: amidase [Acidobacteriota bacterium]|nr:amidase [Acidobacteriota bacterium]